MEHLGLSVVELYGRCPISRVVILHLHVVPEDGCSGTANPCHDHYLARRGR